MVSDSWGVAPLEERVGGFLEGASGNEERKRYWAEKTLPWSWQETSTCLPPEPSTPDLRQFQGFNLRSTKHKTASLLTTETDKGVLWV